MGGAVRRDEWVDSVHLASWPTPTPPWSRRPGGRRRPGAPPGRTGPGRARRFEGQDAPAAGAAPACRRRAGRAGRRAEVEVADELNVESVARLADAAELVDSRSSRTSARWAGASARTRRRSPTRSAADRPPLATAASRGTGTSTLSTTRPRSRSAARTSSSPRRPGPAGRSQAQAPDTVALDLELTHELRLLGLLRDIVRIVQDARKNAGLEVTDRIELRWRVGGSPEPAEAIRTHARPAGERGAGDRAARGRARGRSPSLVRDAGDERARPAPLAARSVRRA